MKSIACIIIVLIMLWPQLGATQTVSITAKIFCPQCSMENKPAARFCPQCGSSLPKRESMPVNLVWIDVLIAVVRFSHEPVSLSSFLSNDKKVELRQ